MISFIWNGRSSVFCFYPYNHAAFCFFPVVHIPEDHLKIVAYFYLMVSNSYDFLWYINHTEIKCFSRTPLGLKYSRVLEAGSAHLPKKKMYWKVFCCY